MKTYIGQRGRDKVLRVWVEHHGRRYPIRTGDLPRRMLVTARSVVVHQWRERVPPEIGVAFRGAGLEDRLAPVNAQALRPGSVGRNN